MSDLVPVKIVAMGSNLGAWVPVTLTCGHSSEMLNFGISLKVGAQCFCTDCAIERWEATQTANV